MTNPRVLLVYGTKYGQTGRIIERVAAGLRTHGFDTTVLNGADLPPGILRESFAGVVIGASVIIGRHQRCIQEFVRAHSATLDGMPSAFISVSGAAASPKAGEADRARVCMETFLRETGWHPAQRITIGGAIAYRRYDPITRWVMKRIARRTGLDSDTSRNHVYTDWAAVDEFTDGFAESLTPRPSVATAAV